jgi:hypothetical protein
MGTTQPRRRRRTRDTGADDDGRAEKAAAPAKMSGAKVAQRVREELSAITGLPAESVISLQRNDDGWTVTVEMLELSRIPETDDVLGSYQVDTDAEGELEGYRRLSRYTRSHQFEQRDGQ